jgi:SAM-dependent methyltransferase
MNRKIRRGDIAPSVGGYCLAAAVFSGCYSEMEFSVRSALERALTTLTPVLDIIEHRVDDAEVPAWCSSRAWDGYLLGLSDADLSRSEALGLASVAETLPGMPLSLAELAARVRESSALPAVNPVAVRQAQNDVRGVSQRKQEQLSALLGSLGPLVASARRIVDVGAGSGHFTRLSAQHFSREALGLERDPERVARAKQRAASGAELNVAFAVVDALQDGLQLRVDDLAIGLHACGELGDTLVRAVGESGADLALVSCCLQKISTAERQALSRSAAGFVLSKDILGLSNLTSQAIGVEASMEHNLRAREARYALRQLLRARGLDVAPNAELRGINRRRAQVGLSEIAARALEQRGLAPASPAEVTHHEAEARRHFHAIRRLSLPRNMLARVVELSVVLDRAAHLEECGYFARVATLFDCAVTPRNVSLFASRDPSRLPALRS